MYQRATFCPGDRIRVDIPDERDLDFEAFHGRHGEVIKVFADDGSAETGDERDEVLYRVRLDDGEQMDFRWRDLRPV